MFEIPIYRVEREDGLVDKIRASASILYASQVKLGKASPTELDFSKLKHLPLNRAKSSQGDFDLHYLNDILVSTGWNLNDDIFEPVETWLARHTPEDKPFNYNHDCSQIVGHITNNIVVARDGSVIADDIVIDDVPDEFDIVTGSVLYKEWDREDLQKRMDNILEEIAKGNLFVSMECLFQGFDYGILTTDGQTKVVARNDQTAFLTKHLKIYGGSGKYNGQRIGRLLRNIVFSGKGLVEKPANPRSEILPSSEPFASSKAEYLREFSQADAGQVYSPMTVNQNGREKIMTITIESLQADLAAKNTEIEKLKAGQTETVINELKAKLTAAETAKVEADKLLAAASTNLTKQSDESKALAAKLAEAEKVLKETKDELSKLYAEQTKAKRVSTIKDKLKLKEDDATKLFETVAALNDDQFTALVEIQAKAMTTNNPAGGNTSFDHNVDAKLPPKSTDKKDKADDMLGAGDIDDDGDTACIKANLNGVKDVEPAVAATVTPDSGVTDLQKAISNYFGYADEEK